MKDELIRVDYDGACPTVLARDLYDFLEIKSEYKAWIDAKFECDFWGRGDFFIFRDKDTENNGRELYLLSISMAKEICLLSFSQKAKKCRDYLTVCEEFWNCPDKVMERALQIAIERVEKAERRYMNLLKENKEF
jgi:anti-repressor protein